MWYDALDRHVLKLEKLLGKPGTAAALTLLLFVMACLYVRPAFEPVAMGVSYARLADNPWHPQDGNPLGLRILVPAISYLIGLRGDLILVTNLLFAIALIGSVYWYFRTRMPRPGDGFTAAAVITFSLTTLTTIFYGGYTDSASYLIFFLLWQFRSTPWLSAIWFTLGGLNRESMLFLLPWYASEGIRESSQKTRWMLMTGGAFAVATAITYFIREEIKSRASIVWDFDYYLGQISNDLFAIFSQSYPLQGLGLFTVYKLLWVLPIVAAWSLWKSGQKWAVVSMGLLLVGTASQLFLAWDSSRLFTHAFMIMIPALVYLMHNNELRVRDWILPLLLGNLLVPQLYTARNILELMYSTPGNWLLIEFLGKQGW